MAVYSRVLALIDSSALRFKIVERSVEIASMSGAALRIGHVADATPYINANIDLSTVSETLRAGFERDFESLLSGGAEEKGISDVEVNVVAGYMPDTLHHQLVHPFKPDLIICGNRELSDLSYLISGSVSTHLVRTVKCDVLVVKEDCR